MHPGVSCGVLGSPWVFSGILGCPGVIRPTRVETDLINDTCKKGFESLLVI